MPDGKGIGARGAALSELVPAREWVQGEVRWPAWPDYLAALCFPIGGGKGSVRAGVLLAQLHPGYGCLQYERRATARNWHQVGRRPALSHR